MTISARLTSDRKIQLPDCVIKKMNMSINDEIIMELEGTKLVLMKKEEIQTDKYGGSPKKVWNNADAEEYLKDEGNSGDSSGY